VTEVHKELVQLTWLCISTGDLSFEAGAKDNAKILTFKTKAKTSKFSSQTQGQELTRSRKYSMPRTKADDNVSSSRWSECGRLRCWRSCSAMTVKHRQVSRCCCYADAVCRL